jgi:hypothetical protein
VVIQINKNNSNNFNVNTRWFKYDRDYLCVNKSQFVPVIFEPPCISERVGKYNLLRSRSVYC